MNRVSTTEDILIMKNKDAGKKALRPSWRDRPVPSVMDLTVGGIAMKDDELFVYEH